MTRVLILFALGCTRGDPRHTDAAGTEDSTATTGVGTGATTAPSGRMTQSGAIACADPSKRADGAFSREVYGEDWPKHPDYRTPEWTLTDGGRGVVVADFDRDGALDILVPRDRFPARFLRGDGAGGFAAEDGVFQGVDVMGHNGGSAGDLDGDGDPDAVLYGLQGTATVLVNEGDHFAVVERGDWDTGDAPYGCGGASAWADYDRDGDLDLFYGRLGGTDPYTQQSFRCDSRLLRNDGSGTMVPDDGQLSADLQSIRVMAAGWYDFDGNGWLDLYAVSDAPPMRNYLLLNHDGVLSQPAVTGLEVITAGMGLGVGDLNDDGLPDATISGIRELPTLLSNAELGLWVESSAALALRPAEGTGRTIAWGGDLADLDNDGFLDAVFTYGGVYLEPLPKAQPNEIFRNRGDGSFEPVGDAWGWNEQNVGRGAITVDLNGDGWLDIVDRELGGVVTVSTAVCGQEAWLALRLHDEDHPNHDAIGAKVTVVAGARSQVRWVTAGSQSYCSGGPPALHFGLGDALAVDRIEVLWPTGDVRVYPGVASRQIVDLWPHD